MLHSKEDACSAPIPNIRLCMQCKGDHDMHVCRNHIDSIHGQGIDE